MLAAVLLVDQEPEPTTNHRLANQPKTKANLNSLVISCPAAPRTALLNKRSEIDAAIVPKSCSVRVARCPLRSENDLIAARQRNDAKCRCAPLRRLGTDHCGLSCRICHWDRRLAARCRRWRVPDPEACVAIRG